MAGAMRRMGIYLGLVEDDDTRGYGRYDARQSDHPDDRRYGRYAADEQYGDQYGSNYEDHYEDDVEAEPVRAPEPISTRRVVPNRPLGLAPTAGSASGGSRASAMGSGPVSAGAAGLAVREPVVAVAPEPEPARAGRSPTGSRPCTRAPTTRRAPSASGSATACRSS